MSMKKKKQIPAIGALILFIAVFIGAGQAFALTDEATVKTAAVTTPVVSVEQVSAAPGESVEVNISIENNPGILGATFTLTYDEQLTLTNAQAGDAFGALSMTKPGKFTSPCNFVWDGQELEEEDIKDGVILTLTFQVSDEAQAGENLIVDISYRTNGVVDKNLQPVPEQEITMVGGGITVVNDAERVPDISSSGILDETGITFKLSSGAEYQKITLMVAVYSCEGQMLGCDVQTVAVPQGDSEYFFEKAYENAVYKGFILDEEMRPCSPAVQFKEEETFTVTFTDYDGTPLSVQTVLSGEDAVPPADPVREGYVFIGWDGSYTKVTANRTVTAQYQKDTTPTIIVGSVSAKPGDTGVQVSLRLLNNPGILGMALTLRYNDENLTLTGAENGAAVKDVLSMTKPGEYVSPCNFLWDGQEITPEQIQNGEILILTFDVAESAAGTYPIEVSYKPGGIVDNEFGALTLVVQNGGITVEK